MKELIQTWNWKTALRLAVLFLLLLTFATIVFKKVQQQYAVLLECSGKLNTEISYKLQSLDKLDQNSFTIYISLLKYELINTEIQKNRTRTEIDSLQTENTLLINRLKNLVTNQAENALYNTFVAARESYSQKRSTYLLTQWDQLKTNEINLNRSQIEIAFKNFRIHEQALVDYEHKLILQATNDSVSQLLDYKYRINALVIGFIIALLLFALIAFLFHNKLVVQYNKLRFVVFEKDNATNRLASILDTLPANIALINKKGIILTVNNSWKVFADQNGFKGDNYGIGANYLEVAKSTCCKLEDNGEQMAAALKQIMEGSLEKYSMVYPCHAPNQKRWFKVIAARENSRIDSGVVLMHLDITQQHQAELKIQQSEANLKQVINLVPHPISVRDVQGKFILTNCRFEELYGIKTTGKLINKLLIDTIPDKEQGRISLLEDYEVALSGKTKIIPDAVFTDSTNEIHRLNVTKVPYYPLGTNEKAILEISLDITAQVKSELELKKAEANYREIFDKAVDGIFILDAKTGKIINANQHAATLTGFNKDELIGNYPAFIAENDTTGKLIQVTKIMADIKANDQLRFEWNIKRRNNNATCVEVNINKAVIAGNERLILFFNEIGERKRTEEALKISEANLHTIFNSTDIAFILFDKALNIISYNNVAGIWSLQVFNSQLKEGNNLSFLFNELWKMNADETMQQMLSGKPIYREIQFAKPGGKTEWYMVHMNTVIDGGNIIGFCLSVSNITASKCAEVERLKMTEDLIQRNNDLEQFTYIVSHNLRSPVANIMGLATALQAKVKPAEEIQMKSDLNLSVLKLDTVIKDLNHILQVKSEVSEQKEFVHFVDIINDIKNSIPDVLQKNNVNIICDFKEPDAIFTLKSYLHSIMFNLISNSIKYRKFDIPPVIEIKSSIEGSKTIITYKDNGLGMDLEKKNDQVFGLYKRFHFHTEGKGMGLFMVKTQVETLGGHISIKSTVNKGTEFRLEFEN